MCLTEVYTDQDMNAIIEELPEVAPGIMAVYRVVAYNNKKYSSSNFFWDYSVGYNKADKTKVRMADGTAYFSGFHSYLVAMDCFNNPRYKKRRTPRLVQKCGLACLKGFARKESITSIGTSRKGKQVIVSDEIFLPKYPIVKAKLEDFLIWLKENDPEWAESQVELIKEGAKAHG